MLAKKLEIIGPLMNNDAELIYDIANAIGSVDDGIVALVGAF